MRILHVYKSYFPDTVGGCEYMIKTLTKHSSKLGCENTLLTLGSTKVLNISQTEHLKVITYPVHLNISSCPFNFRLLRGFQHYARQADIVHFHFPWPFADLFYLLSRVNKPSIVTYHSDIVKQKFLKQIYRPCMNKFLTRVNKIVVTSPNYRLSSQDLLNFQTKIDVIPLGICKEDYAEPDAHILSKWQKQVGENFILFLGVLRAYKGLPFLLQSVANTNIPLVIAGTGPEIEKLKTMSKDHKNVQFIGRITDEDKMALLQLCKAMALPSHLRSEAFGFCLLEAMLFRKALITTELGTGTSYVNAHQETGLVVPPGDAQALGNAISDLYKNEEMTKKMGQQAHQRYQTHFTAEHMAQQYITCYQSLIN